MTGPSVDSAGYPRYKDVGVGAISDRSNFTFQASKDIPAGMEIVADYREDHFQQSRKEDYESVPMKGDSIEADTTLDKFWEDVEQESGERKRTMYDGVVDSIANSRVKPSIPKTYEQAGEVKEMCTMVLSMSHAIL